MTKREMLVLKAGQFPSLMSWVVKVGIGRLVTAKRRSVLSVQEQDAST